MYGLLDFDRSPPFAAPLRFFLVAPVFGMLAGLLLAVDGQEALISRWSPATLALTHLLTVGFMLHAMLGALIQVLPVVAGVSLPHPGRLAAVLQASLSLGTLMLVAGFWGYVPFWLQAGGGIVLLVVLCFVALVARYLLPASNTSPTILALKLSLVGLAGVVLLGFWLVLAMLKGTTLSLAVLTDLHVAWGLGAWAGILLAGVAFVVVPMFQLTPAYPARPSWLWPGAVVALCLLGLPALGVSEEIWGRVMQGGLGLAGLAFAVLSLRLQARRRRPRPDATLRYWQLGLSAGALACALISVTAFFPAMSQQAAWPLVMGVLLIGAGFMSLIAGMLYKIVPFLAWMHLQNLGQGQTPAPSMNQILADPPARRQFLSHLLAMLVLLAAVIWPAGLARPAGICLLFSQGWLLVNLAQAAQCFDQHRRAMGEAVSGSDG